jgi:hypothetical protein
MSFRKFLTLKMRSVLLIALFSIALVFPLVHALPSQAYTAGEEIPFDFVFSIGGDNSSTPSIPPLEEEIVSEADLIAAGEEMGRELDPQCFNHPAGTPAEEALCLGNIEHLQTIDGKAFADMTPEEVYEATGKGGEDTPLSDFEFLNVETFESVATAIDTAFPGWKEKAIAEVPMFAEAFGVASGTIESSLGDYEFANQVVGDVVNLSKMDTSDLPGMMQTSYRLYTKYYNWLVKYVPGLPDLQAKLSGIVTPMRLDLPWSTAEAGDSRLETLYIAGKGNSKGATEPQPCKAGKPCSYMELMNFEGNPLSFFFPNGTRYQVSNKGSALKIAGEAAKELIAGVEGGYGPLKIASKIFGLFQEYGGRNINRFGKLVVSECDEASGSCEISLAIPPACGKYPPPNFPKWTCSSMTILLKGVLGRIQEGGTMLVPLS